MALDPNIALSYRPPRFGNALADYAGMMQIQNAGNQNRLAEIQYRNALKAEADDAALRNSLQGVDISTPEGLSKARNALLGVGNVKGAMELDKNALATKKTQGEISKQDADLAYQKLSIFGGALAPLAQNPTRQAILSTLQALEAQGIKAPPIPLPADDALLPGWVRQVGAMTDKGLKALEAFSPKVDMTNLGATVQPTNTNALAGPVGPLPKVEAMQTTPTGFTRTPDGKMAIDPGYLKGKAQIAAAGAPRVSVQNQSESAYAKEVGGESAKQDIAQHNAAKSAIGNIAKLDSVINQLNKSKAITGMGAEVLLNLERTRKLLLGKEAGGTKVTDTELLDTMLGSDVFPMIQSLGIGARGMDTPAEREFLRKVMTGTITMNKDTLVRMAEIRRDIAKRSLDNWNERVKGGEVDRYFKQSGNKKQELKPLPAPDGGQISTGKVSGVDPSKLSDAELKRELGIK